MYIGAFLTVASNVVTVVSAKGPGSGLAPVHAVSVGGAVLTAAVPALAWLWMAWKTQTGRAWARVLSTVFFSFTTLVMLGLVTVTVVSHAYGSPGAALYFSVAEWGAGLAAIILLWARDASDYFNAARLVRAMKAYPPLPPPGYGPPGYGPPGYGPPE
jgi:hypothetical protein